MVRNGASDERGLPRQTPSVLCDLPAAREPDGECVVGADSIALQCGPSAVACLGGELVDGAFDAATGHRAGDGAVGGDHHRGAGRSRCGPDRADHRGDARGATRVPNRHQLVEHITHRCECMRSRDDNSLMTETAFPRGIAGVLLAAGAGTRYGKPKVLVDGWLPAAVTALADGGCARVIVVLGAAVVPAPPDVIPVTVPDWHMGLSASVRAGLAEAERIGADYAVLHVIDTPDVGSAVVARVIKRALASRSGLARACFGDRPGHPVVIARRHWPDLIGALADRLTPTGLLQAVPWRTERFWCRPTKGIRRQRAMRSPPELQDPNPCRRWASPPSDTVTTPAVGRIETPTILAAACRPSPIEARRTVLPTPMDRRY
jgi:molybdenum cofactor cytidylyltransferase